jgi:hypothetical protein
MLKLSEFPETKFPGNAWNLQKCRNLPVVFWCNNVFYRRTFFTLALFIMAVTIEKGGESKHKDQQSAMKESRSLTLVITDSSWSDMTAR